MPGRGYEASRVQILGKDTWIVRLDMELTETVCGMTIKNPRIRYPLRVVRHAVDPERNPWDLALDGYGDKLKRLPHADSEMPDA